ncbi:MAG: hypothetical protein ACOYOP_08745 [Microthrixaceae bacterium]
MTTTRRGAPGGADGATAVRSAWDEVPVWAAGADTPASPAPPPRRRRRWWIALPVAALFVLLLAVAIERFGRSYAASEIRSRLERGGLVTNAEVTVGASPWRPVVWPALLTGDVDRVVVRVTDGTLADLPVRSAVYELEGIHGDLSLRDGTVGVNSLDRGSVRLVLDPAVLGRASGTEVRARGDRLVTADGAPVGLALDGDDLVVEVPGAAPTRVQVVDPYVMPCRPDVSVRRVGVVLACTGDTLPGILRTPLAGVPDGAPPATSDSLLPPQSTIKPGG